MSLFDLAPKESEEALFGRAQEIAELTRLVRARRWVVVLGPRMVGKTSLVKAVRNQLDRPGAYVNLWGVRTIHGLLEGLIAGLNESASLRSRIVRAARRLEGISAGPSGMALSAPRRPLKTAWDLFDLLGAEKQDCFVVLDEVQELASNSGALLKLLGNIFNTRPNIVFVFTGSLVGLSRTLLEPSIASPLFGRAPVPISLGPFDRPTSEEFLTRGAAEQGIRLTPGKVNDALSGPLDGTPGWLTLFGNHVTVRKLAPDVALTETIKEGKKVAQAEIAHFLSAREASLYWPALKAMAVGASWSAVREYMGRSDGRTPNDGTVSRIIHSLEHSFLARNEEGVYSLVDPMIRAFVLEARASPRVVRGPRGSPRD